MPEMRHGRLWLSVGLRAPHLRNGEGMALRNASGARSCGAPGGSGNAPELRHLCKGVRPAALPLLTQVAVRVSEKRCRGWLIDF